MKRKILALAVLTLVVGCHTEPDILINTPEINFDIFWNDFDRNYSFFEQKGIDWEQYKQTYRPRIHANTSPKALLDILSEIILSLKDAHASLTANSNFISYDYTAGHPKNSPINLSNYVTLQSAGSVLKHGIIRGTVGFLMISKFQGSDSDFTITESIFTDWQNKNLKGIIIDIRGNGGGSDALASHIIEKLNDSPRIYSKVKYRNGPAHNDFTDWVDRYTPASSTTFFKGRPIVVLTNRYVVSAAESFVLAMRTIPGVKIVGDTTGGSSGNPLNRRLPNGWQYRVPRWIEVTPDYTVFENKGLYPDVPVWLKQEDVTAGKDTIIEKALELIN
ncbi:peptidase S41 [Cytophagales bacterium WSM2-2]|nr:peptidase S41 [Cytophagales bacterium WSM2-2]